MVINIADRQKLALSIIIVVASALLVLASVYFLNRRQYDIRTSAEDGNCTPVSNQIIISPSDSSLCLTLRGAVNAISDASQYTIRFQPGEYQIDEAINIDGKNLLISGDSESGSKAVKINLTNQINIKNSTVSFEWLEMKANTNKAVISGNGLKELNLQQTHLSNVGGSVLELARVDKVNIKNSEIFSSARAAQMSEVVDITLDNCRIHDNNQGIEISKSSGNLTSNIISNQSTDAIVINNPLSFIVDHNTFSDNRSGALTIQNTEGSQDKYFEITNNIITNNNSGLVVKNLNQDYLNIENNNIWNNATNTTGVENIIGENGNISEDPLFGPSFCLNQNSPAIYGEINRGEFMGYKRFNKPLCN